MQEAVVDTRARVRTLALARAGWVLAGSILAGLALVWPPLSAAAQRQVGAVDTERSRFEVELRTRWGQRVVGDFPRFEGELIAVDARRRQVRLRLATDAVVIGDSERYTRMARGETFFDADRYPYVQFVSDPLSEDEVRRGGILRGRLTIRGTTRFEIFQMEPAACDQPGRDCDVVARGRIDRHDYGLSAWRLALDNHVYLTMRVRLDKDTLDKGMPDKSALDRGTTDKGTQP